MVAEQNGFTLVELAIVLMIIGLLIGGVLRGQELLKNAQITSTVQQVKAYEGAMVTFRDAYASLPGDMVTAMNRLPGCNAGNNCTNGDGNGMIGDLGTGAAAGQPWIDVPNAVNTENTQFWKHLSLAHLISGVNPSAATPQWGVSHPTAKVGAGFFIRYTTGEGTGQGASRLSGHILVLRLPISGAWACGGGGNPISLCAISPQRGSQIDRKTDDGNANAGDVRAISANWNSGCGVENLGTNGPNGYAETQTTNACDMMFKIN